MLPSPNCQARLVTQRLDGAKVRGKAPGRTEVASPSCLTSKRRVVFDVLSRVSRNLALNQAFCVWACLELAVAPV